MILVGEDTSGMHAQATRDGEGTYALVYVPNKDQTITLDLTHLRTVNLCGWSYDPRNGIAKSLGVHLYDRKADFKTPPHGPDWILVLEDPAVGYPAPGLATWTT